MASIFKNPVNKVVENLTRHLESLLSDDEDKKQKAITKLSDDIAQIHFMLYGNSDDDPKPEHITKLVPKLLQADTDLFCKLAQHISLFEFEAKKQTADIMNYIIRRCPKYGADEYIRSKTDGHGHNVIIDCLLRGYHDQHLAQNVGSVLQEMSKRQELAPMLLNNIRITRKKEKTATVVASDGNDEKQNEQPAKPDVASNEDEMEERQVVDELFVLVQKPSFDIASDAYKTLQLLLTRHKKLLPTYLEQNYIRFFGQFNELIQSDNYVTQRQFLNLLSEILLEKANFNLMIRYIGEKENLRIAMTLLKNQSNAISHEAFHIFKVFVANPKKARDIHIVLWKNKDKLVQFLENFLPEKAKDDEAFAEEKKIVISHLQKLAIPDEIQQHRKLKARAQSQGYALMQNATSSETSSGGIQKSKSIPNVIPPPTANDHDANGTHTETSAQEANEPNNNDGNVNGNVNDDDTGDNATKPSE